MSRVENLRTSCSYCGLSDLIYDQDTHTCRLCWENFLSGVPLMENDDDDYLWGDKMNTRDMDGSHAEIKPHDLLSLRPLDQETLNEIERRVRFHEQEVMRWRTRREVLLARVKEMGT